jgi:hypothetical protein
MDITVSPGDAKTDAAGRRNMSRRKIIATDLGIHTSSPMVITWMVSDKMVT